jgi:thiol-disulfide isomerase/thioredoxin
MELQDELWRALALVSFILAVVEAVVLLGVLRELGGVLGRLSPARPGEIDGGPAVGSQVSIPGRQFGKPTIVLFASDDCPACSSLLPGLPNFANAYRDLELILIDAANDDAAISEDPDATPSRLYRDWAVPGTPFAVGVDTSGKVIGRGVTNTLDHLEALASALAQPHRDEDLHEISPPILKERASAR